MLDNRKGKNTDESVPLSFSNAITQLRFPMAIMVVAIHWNAKENEMITDALTASDSSFLIWFYSLYENMLHIAVPLFFIFSGYLLFVKRRRFAFEGYRDLLKSRFYTLVIPYIIWNALAYFLWLIKPILSGGGGVGVAQHFSASFPLGILEALWIDPQYHNAPWPALIPLWFIRELIVMTVLSPVFYLAFRAKGGKLWQVFKIVLFIGGIYSVYYLGWVHSGLGISFSSMLSFSLGCVLALKKLEGYLARHALRIALPIFFAACFLSCWEQSSETTLLLKAFVPLAFAFSLLVYMLTGWMKWNMPSCFAKSTMFVFCWHSLTIVGGVSILSNLAVVILPENLCLSMILAFIIFPPIVIAMLGTLLYSVGKKFFPRTMRILTGR